MLKITRTDSPERSRLHLEGRLTVADVPALDEACTEAQSARRALVLDLAGLRFADRTGTVALQRLRAAGARLDNATAFLTELLQEEGI